MYTCMAMRISYSLIVVPMNLGILYSLIIVCTLHILYCSTAIIHYSYDREVLLNFNFCRALCAVLCSASDLLLPISPHVYPISELLGSDQLVCHQWIAPGSVMVVALQRKTIIDCIRLHCYTMQIWTA